MLTLILFLLIWLLLQILRFAIRAFQRVRTDERAEFWVRQGINLGLTLRFMTDARGERDIKDAISRDLLSAFETAGIALTPEPVTP